MTQLEILDLACTAARDMWYASHERLQDQPQNSIRQHREAQNWERLKELERLWNAERCKA
jgi:hypothetical protein